MFAELMYSGTFDLQKLKTKLTSMQAVGNVKERMLGGSEGETATHAEGTTWSEGEHHDESRSTSKGAGAAHTVTDTNSNGITLTAGTTNTKSESDTEQRTPDGEVIGGPAHTEGESDAQSESAAVTAARARAVGNTASTNLSDTEGTSTGHTSQRGGSESDSLATSKTDNWSEAYRTEYRELPAGDTWSLEELIHRRQVSLRRARTGYGHCQAQTAHPQRVHIVNLGGIPILPSMAARLDEKFTAEAEENGDPAAIDRAIEARIARLEALAPEKQRRARRTRVASRGDTPAVSPEDDPEDEDPNDEAAWEALRRRSEGGGT